MSEDTLVPPHSVGDFVDRRSLEEIEEEKRRDTLALIRGEQERLELRRRAKLADYIVDHAKQEPVPPPAPMSESQQERPKANLQDIAQKLLLDSEEVYMLTGISPSKLSPMLMRKEILSIKHGNQRLIPRAALEQFIKEQLGDAEETETSEGNRNHHPAQRRTPRGTSTAR